MTEEFIGCRTIMGKYAGEPLYNMWLTDTWRDAPKVAPLDNMPLIPTYSCERAIRCESRAEDAR